MTAKRKQTPTGRGSSDEAAILRRAAARARTRPEFMAWVLAAYQDIEGMTEARLRDHLGVTHANWPRLELCLRPRAETFLKDVTRIAEGFGIERDALAAVVRRVDVETADTLAKDRRVVAAEAEPGTPERIPSRLGVLASSALTREAAGE